MTAFRTIDRGGKPAALKCGRVITSRSDTRYKGAQRETNNAGEIEAIGRGLEHAARQKLEGEVCIRTDSRCAMAAILGRKRPKQNTVLVKWARRQLHRLRARLGYVNVDIRHVYGHQGNDRNEVADALAKRGAEQEE